MDKKHKQYYLYIDGQAIPVSEQVYQTFWHYENKEDYFMRQLKQKRTCRDKKTQAVIVVPARERSLEQMPEAGCQISAASFSMEQFVLSEIWLEELLELLTEEERVIVRLFYIQGESERFVSTALGLPKTTFRRREQRLREKLRILLRSFL